MTDRKFWAITLAFWLLLWGLLSVTNFRFDFQGFLMGVLAIVAAVLLFIDR